MKEKAKCLLKLIFLTLAFSSLYAYASNNIQEKILRSLENFAKNHRIQATYIISQGENVLVSGAQGYSDLLRNQRLPKHQMMPVLSISKQVTAAGILVLRDRNLLNLHDNLAKYSNAFKNLWSENNKPKWLEKITIHNLLLHTSGIEDYIGKFPIAQSNTKKDFESSLGGVLLKHPPQITPDSVHLYNNTNYYLLGLLIEEISGMKLSDFFQKEFFDPLGMENTYLLSFTEAFEIQQKPRLSNFPIRYFLTPTENSPKFSPVPRQILLVPGGDCGLVSNAKDLIIWNRGLHNGKILSKTSYQKMIKPYHRIIDKRNGYSSYIGYGMYISILHNGKKYYHYDTGGYGVRCDTGYIPKYDLTLAILSNVAFNIPNDMASKVDFRRPENQIDIAYLRDAMLEAL